MVGKWHDKRNVLYISTRFENDWAVSNNRFGQSRQKPLPIVHYNAHMKGVDRNDQMMSYYPYKRDMKGDRFLRKRCRQCAKEKKKTTTVFICSQCPGEPGLCALPCFDKWHSP
ncbi:hypothetical protein J6590_009575 [Homalodisca vitripennis]|nr:hypothetical protein J6590_009575 [Homalodisca vitripennis]